MNKTEQKLLEAAASVLVDELAAPSLGERIQRYLAGHRPTTDHVVLKLTTRQARVLNSWLEYRAACGGADWDEAHGGSENDGTVSDATRALEEVNKKLEKLLP